MSLQISLEALENLIIERLRSFYDRRISRLLELKLNDLASKNPYLFRATGISEAPQLVEELMRSRLIKSDETIFGDEFFEKIAKAVGDGAKAEQVGMDIVIETESDYIVIEMKSGSNWQNARMGRGIKEDFDKAYQDYCQMGIQKRFVAILGQSTGQANSEPDEEGGRIYLIRSGQALWEEITGDSDFYLKLTRLMKDYPLRLRPDYQDAWATTLNKLTREFSLLFVDEEGHINWEKLTQANSGYIPPRRTRRRSSAN
ncbi:cytoplasmic protein [Phormidium sp. FACHB-592]|uniref:Cytoplasmic protein n=1 Tax=Stenomitos frigidus AS-A4 TaxID=2933935 RepID=A0ABV0KEH2_9CYAN|nr:PmeII family type II restriction endonuclease [Phormidium sp. FACHB-592]MBD2076239.1 cytoplasmic protein [Phormidium sp. FACHB-592]MBD2076244.1 cytoplasmic protein [Phormidium sp. FACHB-592]